MRTLSFSVLLVFLTTLAFSAVGCLMRTRNGEIIAVGVGVVHDERWYYDNEYDDNWRRSHPWRTGYHYKSYKGGTFGVAVVRDERWYYDNEYDDNWRRSHPWRKGYHYKNYKR